MTENQRLEKLKQSVFVFVCITVLYFGKINSLSPFYCAFFYASFIVGKAGLEGALALLLCSFYDGISFFELIVTLASVLPFAFYFIFKKATKKDVTLFLKILFCVTHFCVISILAVSSVYIINVVINGVVTLCFSYVFKLCYSFFSKTISSFSSDTALGCTAFALVAFGAGFSGITIFSTPLLVAVAGFAILFSASVIGKEYGVICALSLGCGYAVCNYDVYFIALFGFCALCCIPFSSAKRIFPYISALMGITVFELYFAVEYVALPFHLLFFALGGLAYLLIPARVLNAIIKQRQVENSSFALRYLINKNRIDTATRLRKLRQIFAQMSSSLAFLKSDTEKVSSRLALRTEEDVCKKCENYHKCGQRELGNALVTLSRLTLIKNKATISSLPPLLENDCIHLASLVGASYNNSLSIRKEVAKIATQNQVKATLSQSLDGICDIISAQEKKIGATLGFDYEREEKIKEELALCGVVCKQVYIALGNDFEITLLIKRDTFNKDSVEKAVSGALRVDSQISKVDDSVIKGWSIVNLIEKPVFSLLASVASEAKNGELSGDTHAFTALSDYAIMVALCDGMGSGEKAEKVSENAISLIEDFYKAGFEHDVTLNSVNSFLRIDNDESFSALDVMVFDRKTGKADIVKLASPPTYVKKSTTTVRVDASSLPLGIISEITPSITSREVEDGDCFVFVSDGVYDCFQGDTLSAFINNASGKNPSLLANAILDEAKRKEKKVVDDMTVIVCKVVLNA